MVTYEMIGVADQNGRTYESKYGTYSKKDGIKLSDLAVKMLKEDLIEKLFHENCWTLKKEPKKMTKEEIEKALGYEIEIAEAKSHEIKITESTSCTNNSLNDSSCSDNTRRKYNVNSSNRCKNNDPFGFFPFWD